MQKVVYSITKVNKDEKIKGVGYLVDGNLLIPSISSKGNPYIRTFEDIAEKCRPASFLPYIAHYLLPLLLRLRISCYLLNIAAFYSLSDLFAPLSNQSKLSPTKCSISVEHVFNGFQAC